MPDLVRMGQSLGAVYLGDQRTRFRVWAPQAGQIDLRLLTPQGRTVPLARGRGGYWQAEVEAAGPGTLYVYRIDGTRERPDPASRYQPDGVHGPSMVVAPDFAWRDASWPGLALAQSIIYELHVGTFTPEGTFEAALQYLPGLKALGITALELMPVAQFPGPRNWGYDGVGLFAVQNSYGGPDGLRRLVDACHREGLGVILDVVYNHLGAEGNYLWDYGPYFTDRYRTPWGSAVNFDGEHSGDVRRYFTENALYWFRDFHVDALRLDAVHAMLDFSGVTFLEELAAAVERQAACLGRPLYLIAESDLNNHRVVLPLAAGGYGLAAQWSDDFHHALHTLLTQESQGYYQDFVPVQRKPSVAYLAKVLREGYAYTGQYSRFRRRRHGNSAQGIRAQQLVVFAQNHDQVGNRMLGDRLSTLVTFDRLKLSAGVLLLSPFVPMLFMGEEYGETSPFQYFVSHGDPELVEAARQGRRAEFAGFAWIGEPPDPAAEETFLRSKLCRQDAEADGHRILYDLYAELIRLRATLAPLRLLSKEQLEVRGYDREMVLYLRRWAGTEQVWAAFNFGEKPATLSLPVPAGSWRKLLDSGEARWRTSSVYLAEPLSMLAAGSGMAVAAASGPRPPGNRAMPDGLASDGAAAVTLPPCSFVLYFQEQTG